MLIVAVQGVRERSRQLQCQNHLREIGLGLASFESTFKSFPSGGWGSNWAAIPELGYGPTQPAGWIYHVAPFVEINTFDIARHGLSNLLTTPQPLFSCPSRRSDELGRNARRWAPAGYSLVEGLARGDYAMNGGQHFVPYGPGPPNIEASTGFEWPSMDENNGLCFQRSQIGIQEVTDGLTLTYLVGEKHLAKRDYFSGLDYGDNECMYSGDDRDLTRWSSNFPLRDSQFVAFREFSGLSFGGPHVAGFEMAFCDGSVRLVSFQIDIFVHEAMGGRDDGEAKRE